jgi:lincosamide and streptogramin A transport system ATP-binding/permease protein
MSMIQAAGLTFGYEGSADTVFENVSFEIDTDWRLGFVGRNGRGKTTFLHLLMNKYEYGGQILASVHFDYFPFPVEEPERLTLAVIEEICGGPALWQIKRELSLLSVEEEALERPFSTLSNGERTKVLLAALFLRENQFLLIDEPTNHLDLPGRRVVSRYLALKKGFILVSHDRAFLDGCVDHILSINKKDILVRKGNFTSWQENMARQEAFELAENQRLAREVKRLSKAAKQTSAWSDQVEKTKFGQRLSGVKPDKGYIGHKAAKMMKRSKVTEGRRQRALEEKAGLLQNLEQSEQLFIQPLSYHKERLLEVRDLVAYYGEKRVCGPLQFTLETGQRLFIQGGNGSGKSSVLKLLAGVKEGAPAFTGKLDMGSRLVISYVSQDASFLRGSLRAFAEAEALEESLFKSLLRKLDFSRQQFDKDMAAFSAGQKKKVLLARSMCQPAHLYIWDEPLNYVDVISRIQIEKLLLEYKPAMIAVEHDLAFCQQIATKILKF